MYQPCLQFPDLVGQRDLHNGKVQYYNDLSQRIRCMHLRASWRFAFGLSLCTSCFCTLNMEYCKYRQTRSSKLQKKMSSSTPKLMAHLFRDGCLNRLESSIPANMLAPQKVNWQNTQSPSGCNGYPCDVETHSLAFHDSDLESVSLDHTWLEHAELAKSIKKRWPRACKLLRGHCAHSVLNFLLDTPQIRRSWTCLERCSCFTRYFGRTLDYHRRSKDFKSWNEAFILLRKPWDNHRFCQTMTADFASATSMATSRAPAANARICRDGESWGRIPWRWDTRQVNMLRMLEV